LTLDPRDERGETLVEIIISIAIMGIAFVALLGGMLTAASMSGRHRTQSEGVTQLVNAVEQVKRAPYDASCAPSLTYPVTLDNGWAAPTEVVKYWDGSSYQDICYDDIGAGYASQQVQVTVTSPDGLFTYTETVVKRA